MPERVLRTGWWRFLSATVRRFNDDQSAVLAGYIAYSSMLAGFPFLIFTITLAGAVIGERYSAEAVATLFDVVPDHVAQTLEPVLHEVIGQQRGGVLTIAALGTIYAASNGVEAIRIGLDRAYDIEAPRNLPYEPPGLGCLCFHWVFGLRHVGCPDHIRPLTIRLVEDFTTVDIPASADIARYVVGGGLLYGMFWLMHWILPARNMRGLRLWPGIVTSMLIWVVLATALSIYLAFSPSYALTYGALAGVIVTLLFFYLTGVAIIFGAQVNAVVNFGLPEASKE